MNQQIRRLQTMTPEEREAYFNGPEFKNQFSPKEQEMMRDLSDILPPKASSHLPSVGTRRRSSSKKFSRNVRLVAGFCSAVPSAYKTAARRLPSGATS